MIGLYRGISVPSSVIQFRTWSPYSHVSEVDPRTGEVIEAWQWGGVQIRGNYHEGHKPGTIIELYEVIGITPAQQRKVWEFLRGEVGKDYDFAGCYGFIRRADRQNPDKWFCSELEFTAYREAKVELLARVEAHKVYPGLLVMSPRLKYVGYLVVGEDRDLLGRVPVSEIAKLRASERPQNGLTLTHVPESGKKHSADYCHPLCSQACHPATPHISPVIAPRRVFA